MTGGEVALTLGLLAVASGAVAYVMEMKDAKKEKR
jgi:hypothetical protein